MNVTRTRSQIAGTLTGHCADCGATLTVPDKGLGRAKLAAWESRHDPICGNARQEEVK